MRHLSIALAVAVAFGAVAAQAQEVVVIGHSAPLTGPQAANGKDNENGARLTVNELNQQHVTVAGKAVTFKLDSQDDQADPKVGVQVAQNLVDRGVVAVLGPYNSGVAIPASCVYSGAGVPLLPVASNPALTQQGFTNIFRIGASDEQLGGTMAEFAFKTLKAKTAAIIDDRTAYRQGVAQQFEKVAKASGLTVVDHQFTNSQTTDFLGILTAIKAENPDVIFFGGVKMLADAMVKAGTTTDKARLTAQLARKHYQGVAGTYSFDARGDLQGAPTTVYVIKDGLPVPYAQ